MTQAVSARVSFCNIFNERIIVSELHITACLFDPWFFPEIASDFCAPTSTKQEQSTKGKWVRVDHNLYKQIGMKTLVCLNQCCT